MMGYFERYNTHAPLNNSHLFIRIPTFGHVLVHSVDKIHLLGVALELVWLLFLNIYFQFCSITEQIL